MNNRLSSLIGKLTGGTSCTICVVAITVIAIFAIYQVVVMLQSHMADSIARHDWSAWSR